MSTDATFIGMDLGTFKTAVASSNGNRAVVQTAVGWPKDLVARALLGTDVVYGEDVNEQRLALDVVRPFYKGGLKYLAHAEAGIADARVEKHKQAARLLVKHAVERVEPAPGAPIFGVIGVPSRASTENLQLILDIAESVFDAAVVVPEPFTIAYGMGRLASTLVVDIGAGTTDLCALYGTFPKAEDQLTIPIGGDAIDDEFLTRMKSRYPEASLSLNMARQFKERHAFVHDLDDAVRVTLPVSGEPREFDVTIPMKEACLTLVEPIIAGIKELVATFDPEFQRPLLEYILLGGGGSQINGLNRLIEAGLAPLGGGKVHRVHDTVFAGAVGALKLGITMSADEWNGMQQLRTSAAA